MDCNTYTASVPCSPADKSCGEPPRPPVPPFVPANFSSAHNCTSCGGPGGKQLGDEEARVERDARGDARGVQV